MPRLAAALLASFLVLPAVVGGVTQDDADDALAVEDELTFTRKGADGGDSAGTKKEPRYFPGKPGPGAPEEKQREVPLAKVENHRILGKDDLTYDFLAEMGFVPPPPPPPWGFSKVNGSLDEIEERVMRQVTPTLHPSSARPPPVARHPPHTHKHTHTHTPRITPTATC